ncbi:glycoside hydrolase family 108 protein [Propionivibrio sp.]|uniref:glycoside hydrolase family 108 protein n=1 Tax=Propionivibrio sp. TaxID=2212460 RepID=UPI003BF0260B
MKRFTDCLQHALTLAEGFTDNHVNPGGARNFGITQAVYNSWNALRGLPLLSVREITPADVRDVYKERYWTACRCEDLPSPLDLVVFDTAIAHGVNRAIKWLQHCVGVPATGILCDATMYAIKGIAIDRRIDHLVESYLDARTAFYAGEIARDPCKKIRAKEWSHRMNTLQGEIGDSHSDNHAKHPAIKAHLPKQFCF